MKNFSEGKTSAEKESTEKIKKFRKTARNAIVAIAVIAMLTISTCVGSSYITTHRQQSEQKRSQARIPLTSDPGATWPKLTLPPKIGGRVSIPLEPGKNAEIDGDNLRVHSVYSDGHECVRASEGEGSGTVCPSGGVTETYVTNKIAKEHVIRYAYAPL